MFDVGRVDTLLRDDPPRSPCCVNRLEGVGVPIGVTGSTASTIKRIGTASGERTLAQPTDDVSPPRPSYGR
jgi:hypothetical protein